MNNKRDRGTPDSSPAPIIVLHSSGALPWQGLFFEQRYHPAGEYSYPAFSALLICLHYGSPSYLEHVGNGHYYAGIMSPGGIQIIPEGTSCMWRHSSGTTFTALVLTKEMIQRVAADLELERIEILPHFCIQDPRIEHINQALLAEIAAGGSSGRIYGEGLATALAAHLISSYTIAPQPFSPPTKGLSAPLLRRLASMIEDRLHEDLSLAELAQEVGLSSSYFSSLFRITTGLSPHRYIVQRRVERAQSLLRSTNLSIDEIATAVGFYDQSHLTAHMRRVLGVTPKYVREHLS